MATQFEIDCALMAGGAYLSNRSDINKFPVPQGWISVPGLHVEGSMGFEAVSFRRDDEIGISFAGTNSDASSLDGIADRAADAFVNEGLCALTGVKPPNQCRYGRVVRTWGRDEPRMPSALCRCDER